MYKTASEIADRVLVKLAGHYQNVVGFDDLDAFQAQRKATLEAEKQYLGSIPKPIKQQAPRQGLWQKIKDGLFGKGGVGNIVQSGTQVDSQRVPLPPVSKQEQKAREKAYFALVDSFQKNITGTDLGLMGKYTTAPYMIGHSAYDGFSDAATDKGYVTKEDLLKDDWLFGPTNAYGEVVSKELQDAIQNSKHKYFTSTRAG